MNDYIRKNTDFKKYDETSKKVIMTARRFS